MHDTQQPSSVCAFYSTSSQAIQAAIAPLFLASNPALHPGTSACPGHRHHTLARLCSRCLRALAARSAAVSPRAHGQPSSILLRLNRRRIRVRGRSLVLTRQPVAVAGTVAAAACFVSMSASSPVSYMRF
jgi:hypothetical protein